MSSVKSEDILRELVEYLKINKRSVMDGMTRRELEELQTVLNGANKYFLDKGESI